MMLKPMPLLGHNNLCTDGEPSKVCPVEAPDATSATTATTEVPTATEDLLLRSTNFEQKKEKNTAVTRALNQ